MNDPRRLSEAELKRLGVITRHVHCWSRSASIFGVSPSTLDRIVMRCRCQRQIIARVRARLEALAKWVVVHPGVH